KLYQGHGKVTLINKIIKSYQRLEMLSTDNDAKSVKSIKDFLFQIPHHAVIYFEKEKDPIKFEEDYASVCAFIQNAQLDRKSTRLNSSHVSISYAVFCLKQKKQLITITQHH